MPIVCHSTSDHHNDHFHSRLGCCSRAPQSSAIVFFFPRSIEGSRILNSLFGKEGLAIVLRTFLLSRRPLAQLLRQEGQRRRKIKEAIHRVWQRVAMTNFALDTSSPSFLFRHRRSSFLLLSNIAPPTKQERTNGRQERRTTFTPTRTHLPSPPSSPCCRHCSFPQTQVLAARNRKQRSPSTRLLLFWSLYIEPRHTSLLLLSAPPCSIFTFLPLSLLPLWEVFV